MPPFDDTDFDDCHRDCRTAGEHTRIWGGCEFGINPEPTVGMWKTCIDPSDGHPFISADQYTLQELADLIEPALVRATVNLGPNPLALFMRGEAFRLSGGETAELARLAAHAIIHRNDDSPTEPPVDTAPVCGKTVSVHGGIYPPCARPPGHAEDYCRDLKHAYYFLADSSSPGLPAGDMQ